jgi:hypothetical protein
MGEQLMDEYLLAEELEELCRAAHGTARYWRRIGYGPPYFKLGRRFLYRRSDVEAWLDELQAREGAADA